MSLGSLDRKVEQIPEPDRIQKYAAKLQQGSFLDVVMTDMFIEVMHQYSEKLASSLQGQDNTTLNQPFFQTVEATEDSVNVGFFLSPREAELNIENFLKEVFQEQTFWEQKAAWILKKLDKWKAGLNPEAIPIVFNRIPEAQTGMLNKETYIIYLCAFYTATEFLKQLDLPSFSLTDLEILLGLRQGMNEATQKLSQLQKKILVRLVEKTESDSENGSADLGFEWNPWEWFKESKWFDKTKPSRRINLSRSLKNLEDRGLIIRQAANGKRTTHVKLTGLGRFVSKMLTN
jgi:hypothetical protein